MIELGTDYEYVYLKELTLKDAPKYFDAVSSSRKHLSQFGDSTSQKYPTEASVAAASSHDRKGNALGTLLPLVNERDMVYAC